MRHFQQHISQIPLFGNTIITAAKILDVEAITLIFIKTRFPWIQYHLQSFNGHILYTYCEKLRYQNSVNIKPHINTNKILYFYD
jgi:hypothetical protein